MLRKLKQKKGASLIMVITTVAVLIAITSAAVTFALRMYSISESNYNKKQAYYAAEMAIRSAYQDFYNDNTKLGQDKYPLPENVTEAVPRNDDEIGALPALGYLLTSLDIVEEIKSAQTSLQKDLIVRRHYVSIPTEVPRAMGYVELRVKYLDAKKEQVGLEAHASFPAKGKDKQVIRVKIQKTNKAASEIAKIFANVFYFKSPIVNSMAKSYYGDIYCDSPGEDETAYKNIYPFTESVENLGHTKKIDIFRIPFYDPNKVNRWVEVYLRRGWEIAADPNDPVAEPMPSGGKYGTKIRPVIQGPGGTKAKLIINSDALIGLDDVDSISDDGNGLEHGYDKDDTGISFDLKLMNAGGGTSVGQNPTDTYLGIKGDIFVNGHARVENVNAVGNVYITGQAVFEGSHHNQPGDARHREYFVNIDGHDGDGNVFIGGNAYLSNTRIKGDLYVGGRQLIMNNCVVGGNVYFRGDQIALQDNSVDNILAFHSEIMGNLFVFGDHTAPCLGEVIGRTFSDNTRVLNFYKSIHDASYKNYTEFEKEEYQPTHNPNPWFEKYEDEHENAMPWLEEYESNPNTPNAPSVFTIYKVRVHGTVYTNVRMLVAGKYHGPAEFSFIAGWQQQPLLRNIYSTKDIYLSGYSSIGHEKEEDATIDQINLYDVYVDKLDGSPGWLKIFRGERTHSLDPKFATNIIADNIWGRGRDTNQLGKLRESFMLGKFYVMGWINPIVNIRGKRLGSTPDFVNGTGSFSDSALHAAKIDQVNQKFALGKNFLLGDFKSYWDNGKSIGSITFKKFPKEVFDQRLAKVLPWSAPFDNKNRTPINSELYDKLHAIDYTEVTDFAASQVACESNPRYIPSKMQFVIDKNMTFTKRLIVPNGSTLYFDTSAGNIHVKLEKGISIGDRAKIILTGGNMAFLYTMRTKDIGPDAGDKRYKPRYGENLNDSDVEPAEIIIGKEARIGLVEEQVGQSRKYDSMYIIASRLDIITPDDIIAGNNDKERVSMVVKPKAEIYAYVYMPYGFVKYTPKENGHFFDSLNEENRTFRGANAVGTFDMSGKLLDWNITNSIFFLHNSTVYTYEPPPIILDPDGNISFGDNESTIANMSEEVWEFLGYY